MAAFVAAFVGIFLFVDGPMFNVVMGIFIAALCVWALVAEIAARGIDGPDPEVDREPTPTASRKGLLPH